MAKSDEAPVSMYSTYLDERGYQAIKIPEATTRTPDLEVSGNGHSYLNELKSPDLQLDQALGLYKFSTTYSKLLHFVHTAIKQFKAHDPSHGKPWVITFTSANFQMNWHTLFEAMQGGLVVEDRVIDNRTGAEVFKRWTKERYVADLYVWLQANDQMQPYQASFFTNERSSHRSLIDEFVNSLRSMPVSNADNNILLV